MKDWNIKGAHFYSQIMNQACAFLGLTADETTEAEVHQAITEAGTLEGVRTQAVSEMELKMSGFAASLSALTEEVATMRGQMSEKDKAIESLEAAALVAQQASTDALGVIAAKEAQIKSLSGEVANLKAAKPTEKTTPVDENIQMPSEGNASKGGGRSISSKDLANAMSGRTN